MPIVCYMKFLAFLRLRHFLAGALFCPELKALAQSAV